MDVTTIKAEIKTWEHGFRAQNGRSATVDDIKALPLIAEKYKLYKKLAKEAEQGKGKVRASQTQVPEPPRTPPPRARRKPRPPSDGAPAIIPKSRPAPSTADTTSKNPFSPVKKTQSHSTRPSTSFNPFLTPVKKRRTPSPDLFPPIPEAPLAAQQNAAVVRARKRLRGESVSPSPLPRDKRRRTNGLDPPARDQLSQARSVSPQVEEGDSFVDDSPVKAPTAGKAFKPLFEEAIPLSQPASSTGGNTMTRGRAFSRAKTMPGGLFGTSKKDTKGAQDRSATLEAASCLFGGESTVGTEKDADRLPGGIQRAKKRRALPGPKGLIPGKDDLFENPPLPAEASNGASSSRKRTLSTVVEDGKKGERLGSNQWGLIPPSPPPRQDDAGRYNPRGKGKAKTSDATQRKSKKARLSTAAHDEDEGIEDEASSSDNIEVKVVGWRGRPQSPQPRGAVDLALSVDPELQHFELRTRTTDARARSVSPLERFEVELPEEMRKILALSPRDADMEKEEDDLVKGLIRGQRRGRGEVWGPGEIGGESEASDEGAGVTRGAEDDWEGEGVPWEAAEL